VVRAGVPVFAEFHGGQDNTAMLVDHAKRLEDAGASLLDFRHSGPVAGEAVARAVGIPVLGGLGGGPWLDGRMRLALAAIGYIDSPVEQYANVAKIARDALSAYAEDVRAGRQIKGQHA
jgi:3-methyl-2-oxobutanoate hydroxymethyltransferase